MDHQFRGFSEAANLFLLELGFHNNRTWFDENKSRFKDFVQEPMMQLTNALAPTIIKIDPEMIVEPKRVISRIYRDTRFSKDKSPYRPNMWLGFKRNIEDWQGEPAFFFEIFPDHYRYGMGFYHVPKTTMDQIRAMIDACDPKFMKMLDWYEGQTQFKLLGDAYKRNMRPALPENLQLWYQKKEIYFSADLPNDKTLRSPQLVKKIAEGFEDLSAFYHFFLALCEKDQKS